MRDAGGVSFIPNLYYVHPIDDSLVLGIDVNAPFGLKTEYDPTWMGRFLAVTSEVKTVNLNPSLAYNFNDSMSVGMGIDFQRLNAKHSNMANYSALAGGALGANLQGLATMKGDDYGWGWNLGTLFNPSATHVGLAYRSEIDYTLEGNVSFSNLPAALAAAVQNNPVTAKVTIPASASFSVFHKLSPTMIYWLTFRGLAGARSINWLCFAPRTRHCPRPPKTGRHDALFCRHQLSAR